MVSAMESCITHNPKNSKDSKLSLSTNNAHSIISRTELVTHCSSCFQGLIAVTLSCLVLSSLSAPAPQPTWPGLAIAGAGVVGFDLATGLVLAGAGGATIPTSLLVAKALVAKKALLLGALAASQAARSEERRGH